MSHIAAGNVELGVGRKGRATKHYQRALELDPSDRTAQTNLAIVSRARGDTADALGKLQSLLTLDPNDPQARRVLDRMIHAVIIDLQWILLGIAFLVFVIRNP